MSADSHSLFVKLTLTANQSPTLPGVLGPPMAVGQSRGFVLIPCGLSEASGHGSNSKDFSVWFHVSPAGMFLLLCNPAIHWSRVEVECVFGP